MGVDRKTTFSDNKRHENADQEGEKDGGKEQKEMIRRETRAKKTIKKPREKPEKKPTEKRQRVNLKNCIKITVLETSNQSPHFIRRGSSRTHTNTFITIN